MINISNILNNHNPNLIIQTLDNDVGRKLYLPIKVSFLNTPFQRIGGLWDTGADISIIQSTYFLKLFKNIDKKRLLHNLDKSDFTLTSYTEHKIKVLGLAKVLVKINSQSETKSLDLYVVQTENEESCKTPVIFSFKILSEFGLTMSFSNIENITVPNIYKEDIMIPSYFSTDAQLSICHGYVKDLEPNEKRHVIFVICPVSPFLPGDSVLITQDSIPYIEHKQIILMPSTSTLEIIEEDLIAHGYVQNLGSERYTGGIKGSIENYNNNYEIQTIEHNTLMQDNVSLITECRPKYEIEQSVRKITLKRSIGKISCKNNIIDPKLYNLNVNFPEFSPNYSNPDCENNDVKDLSKSLSEEKYNINESTHPISQEELNKFYDKDKTIQLGFKDDLAELNKDFLEPEGLGIPDNVMEQPEDIIKENDYEPIIWPYVKNIFLNNYPEVISRHSLDRGHCSQTLGKFSIVLKPHTTLPRFKKLYYMDPKSASQMRDILEFLVKTDVIEKVPCSGGQGQTFASPAFLVARANKQQAARIVVNFQYLNQCIAIDPITLTNLDFILNQLRDSCLFSSLDIKSAFQSLELDPQSARLTTFSTIYGSYFFKVLATGLASSPNSLSQFCDKMIHHEVKRDNLNNIVYDDKGYPIMEPSKIIGCEIYYDDIIMFTKAAPTYEESLDIHFKLVEKVVKRLHFHKAKVEMAKASLGKNRISFLGWFLGNNYLIADPKRIEKLNATPFPMSVKAMRSYLGLLNCLRNTLNFTILRKVHLLTPLTSSKITVYKPTQLQKDTFTEINKLLTTAPLYSKLVVPGSPKILFTDSASEAFSQFSCVLGQVVKPKCPKTIIPWYLLLDDVCDRIIYDHKLPVKPVPLKNLNEDDKEYLKRIQIKDPPCLKYYLEDTLGFGENVDNSLGITLQHMLILHNCTQNYLDICNKIHEVIKKSIYNEQILNQIFKGDREEHKQYLNNIKLGKLYLDEGFYIIKAIGDALYRTISVINSTDSFKKEKIVTFNPGKPKPPFYIKVYFRNNKYIARPLKLDPHSEYNMRKHAGSFEVILYHTKTIPESYKNAKIFDLELFALLSSLEAVKKMVGQDELLALVDNRSLYWLFHKDVAASFVKLCRWGAKIKESFPTLKLHFISSGNNLSDFLSRQLQVSKTDFKNIKLPNYVNSILDDHIPKNKIFTLTEWIDWVNDNPQYLEYITPPHLKNKLIRATPIQYDAEKMLLESIKKNKSKQEIKHNNFKLINTTKLKDHHDQDNLSKNVQSNNIQSNNMLNSKIVNQNSNENQYNNKNNIKIKSPIKTIKNKNILYKINRIQTNKLKGLDKLKAKTNELQICNIKLEILANSKNKRKNDDVDDIPQKTLGMNLSQKFLVRNADAFYNPITSLEKLITIEKIIEYQKEEYHEIYRECVKDIDNKKIIKKQKYEIFNGLLYITKKHNLPKLYIPSKLLCMYISMAHLTSNHAGYKTMIINLANYYHPNLQKYCEKFAKTCLACILVNHPNRGSKLGVFPLDTQPGQALYMDLMESIGTSSGFDHILTIKCPISQYLMLLPMRSKRADEFCHLFINHIWPFFHPSLIYSDCAGFFTSELTMVTLTKLRTRLIYSSAFASYSHGAIERTIKHVKLIFKKILTAEPSYNWTMMPAIASQIHNTTKIPKSGYSPAEILYGTDNHMSQNFLHKDFPKIHPFLKNKKEGLLQSHNQIQKIFEDNKDSIIKERDQRIEKLNKNRVLKPLEEGDIVFVKDQRKLTGGSRPLQAYYHNSPFVVLSVGPSLAIVKQIKSNTVIKRQRIQLKRYENLPEDFKKVLPPSVLRICEQDDFNISQDDIDALIKDDDYEFEHFFEDEDEQDKLDTINFIEEFTKTPPPLPIEEQQKELEEQQLNEDKDDDFIGVKTRHQKTQENLEKLQLNDDNENDIIGVRTRNQKQKDNQNKALRFNLDNNKIHDDNNKNNV
jgi:hypothetical protein